MAIGQVTHLIRNTGKHMAKSSNLSETQGKGTELFKNTGKHMAKALNLSETQVKHGHSHGHIGLKQLGILSEYHTNRARSVK